MKTKTVGAAIGCAGGHTTAAIAHGVCVAANATSRTTSDIVSNWGTSHKAHAERLSALRAIAKASYEANRDATSPELVAPMRAEPAVAVPRAAVPA